MTASNKYQYQPTAEEIEKLYQETEGLKRGRLDCKIALSIHRGDLRKAKQSIQDRQIFLW